MDELFVGFAFNDEGIIIAFQKDDCGFGKAVVIAGHGIVVGPGVEHGKDIAGLCWREEDILDEGICFAALSADGDEIGGFFVAFIGNNGTMHGVIERRAGVIGHAAVDTDIFSDIGDFLDGADGIECDACGADDIAAGFNDEGGHVDVEFFALCFDVGGYG